jgi:benzylsuccinate CoA-transferase BbsE subunit
MYSRAIVQRQTCRNAAPSPTQPTMFRCSDDRWVTFVFQVNNAKMWSAVVEWLTSEGLEVDLAAAEYSDPGYRRAHMAHIQETMEVLFALRAADEACREGQARGLPVSPINAPEDVLSDEHLQAREFFVDFQDVDDTLVPCPGAPVQFSSYRPADIRRSPTRGEHTDEVIREWTR